MIFISPVSIRTVVHLLGGWKLWMKRGCPRAFVVNAHLAQLMDVPGKTIIVMRPFRNAHKLMAHEYGHIIGLEHPYENVMDKDTFVGHLVNAVIGARKAGYPIMSAFGFLRHSDEEGLVREYLAQETTLIPEKPWQILN